MREMIFFVVVVKDASVETGMLDYPSISLVWRWMGMLCYPPDNYKDHCQKGALCIKGFGSGGTHGAPLQCDEGSLRRLLPKSHVVWPGFVSLSELFSGMSPWRGPPCDFPAGDNSFICPVHPAGTDRRAVNFTHIQAGSQTWISH